MSLIVASFVRGEAKRQVFSTFLPIYEVIPFRTYYNTNYSFVYDSVINKC